MTHGSLDGAVAKIGRARNQASALEKEITTEWPPDEPWPVTRKVNGSGLEHRLYLGDLPPIKPDWALVAGEILFDARSALDHLAYELHVRHFRGNVPGGVEGTTQFPIYEHERGWGLNSYRIRSLSVRDRRALKNLQPYVSRNDALRWTRFWLSRLSTWHNADKHRKLHLVTAAQHFTAVPEFPAEYGFRHDPRLGAVESGAHIATWTFTKPPPEIAPEVGAFLDVSLEYRDDIVILSFALFQIITYTGAVLDRFAGHFQ